MSNNMGYTRNNYVRSNGNRTCNRQRTDNNVNNVRRNTKENISTKNNAGNRFFNFISSYKISIIVSIIIFSVLYLAVTNQDVTKSDATNASTKYYTSIRIEPGDSLWDIADRYITDEYSSKQEYIDEVISINKLVDGSSITAGCGIVVPYYKVTELDTK